MTKVALSPARSPFDAVEAALFAADLLLHKGASDVVCLDVRSSASWADTLVIASGDYESQVATYATFVERGFREVYGLHVAVSGLKFGHWVTLDAGSCVVSLFSSEAREYYSLDKLWGSQAVQLDPLTLISQKADSLSKMPSH